jgi:Amidase
MICRGMLGRAWQRLALNHQLPGRSRPWFSQCGTLEQRLCAPISRSVPGRCCGETAIRLHAPARVPPGLSLRSLTSQGAPGEDKYMMNKYLRERGDANIKSNADLIAKAKFYEDPNFRDRKQLRQAAENATLLDTSARLQTRHALQNLFPQCMQEQRQEQRLDGLVSPMSTVPPRKLTAPREPNVNVRSPIGWSLIGQQGFPAITVPAGFTTQVWDRASDGNGGTRLVGPVSASLPVGIDFLARPFHEALLFRIASAFEAATRHPRPPPEFGPLPGEPWRNSSPRGPTKSRIYFFAVVAARSSSARAPDSMLASA